MNGWKKDYLHFFIFSLLMFVPCTTSSAAPWSKGFPPLPSDQEQQEEVSSDKEGKRLPPPPKDSDNIIHYRGQRTYTENLPLEINQINCERKNEDNVSIMIIFNQSINPRSLHRDSFFINNAPLPPGTRFAFNRRGDTIKIVIPMQNNSFKIKIQNISSFDGSAIEPKEVLAEVAR